MASPGFPDEDGGGARDDEEEEAAVEGLTHPLDGATMKEPGDGEKGLSSKTLGSFCRPEMGKMGESKTPPLGRFYGVL